MLSIVTGTIGLAVAVLIIFLIRRDHLHVRHGLTWLFVALCFAVLGMFPGIIDSLARLTGVSYPPILGITVAIALLVIKILLMDLERSKIEMRNQRLIQSLAMLETDIITLRQDHNTSTTTTTTTTTATANSE